jgi:glycogen synthase
MPSEKEGFGIAFIEAMYYHKPVIAGNKDGSVDALLNGKLGLLVNPGKREEVLKAIEKTLSNRNQFLPDQQLLQKHFSYAAYKENWREVLKEAMPYKDNVVTKPGNAIAISDCTTNTQKPLSGNHPSLTSQKALESNLPG